MWSTWKSGYLKIIAKILKQMEMVAMGQKIQALH